MLALNERRLLIFGRDKIKTSGGLRPAFPLHLLAFAREQGCTEILELVP